MKFRHNKKRNSGLIYELLMMNLSTSFLAEGDGSSIDKTLSIIRKHFAPNTSLSEEKDIFSILLNTDLKNRKIADRVFSEVARYVGKMDWKKLEREKTRLARDIKEHMPSNFYERSVPRYRVYASTQQLLNLYKGLDRSVDASVRKIKLEEGLANYLVKNRPRVDEAKEARQQYGSLTMKLFIEGYNEKYKDILTLRQSKLVKRMVEDTDRNFYDYLGKFIVKLDEEIANGVNSSVIKDNMMLRVKYKNLVGKWNTDKKRIASNRLHEDSLASVMRYVGLMDNIKGNK